MTNLKKTPSKLFDNRTIAPLPGTHSINIPKPKKYPPAWEIDPEGDRERMNKDNNEFLNREMSATVDALVNKMCNQGITKEKALDTIQRVLKSKGFEAMLNIELRK